MPEYSRCHCTMLGGCRCDKSRWKGQVLYELITACAYVYVYDYICLTAGNFTLPLHYVVQLYTGQIKSEWEQTLCYLRNCDLLRHFAVRDHLTYGAVCHLSLLSLTLNYLFILPAASSAHALVKCFQFCSGPPILNYVLVIIICEPWSLLGLCGV